MMAFMYGKKMSITASPTLELVDQFEVEVLKKMQEKKLAQAASGDSGGRRFVDVTNLIAKNEGDEMVGL